MGNVLSSRPEKFSVDAPQQIMGDSYLQTYKERPNTANDPTDVIPWGSKSTVQTGVKITQSMQNGQLYVTTPEGKQVFLTQGNPPTPLSNASQLVSQGKNYGRGPAVMLTNSPLNPTITMFTSTDSTADRNYQPVVVNNMADFTHAMEQNQEQRDQSSGAFSGWRGQAAINPFLERGNDFFSGLADVGRFVGSVVTKLAVPALEMGLDEVVPFSGTLIGALGIDSGLKNGLDNLNQLLIHGEQYKSGATRDPQLSNLIADPRLPAYFKQVQSQNQALSQQYGSSTFSDLPEGTAQQMVQKGQQMAQENQDTVVKEQALQLSNLMTNMKKTLGNKTNFDFDAMSQGLAIATNNQARMNVMNHFSQELKQKVLPLLQTHPAAVSSPPVPAKVTAQQPVPVNPDASFERRADVINGDYSHPTTQVTIVN